MAFIIKEHSCRKQSVVITIPNFVFPFLFYFAFFFSSHDYTSSFRLGSGPATDNYYAKV